MPNIQPRSPTDISFQPQSSQSSVTSRDELLNEIQILYHPQEIKHLNILEMTEEELKLLKYLKYANLKYLIAVKAYLLLQKNKPYQYIYVESPDSVFTLSRSYSTKKFKLNIEIHFTKKFRMKSNTDYSKNTYYLNPDPSEKLTILYFPLEFSFLFSEIPKRDFIDKTLLNQYFIIGNIKRGEKHEL